MEKHKQNYKSLPMETKIRGVMAFIIAAILVGVLIEASMSFFFGYPLPIIIQAIAIMLAFIGGAINELLLKVLCHNIVVLIHESFELGIDINLLGV